MPLSLEREHDKTRSFFRDGCIPVCDGIQDWIMVVGLCPLAKTLFGEEHPKDPLLAAIPANGGTAQR
jgi:hypothetical protein